MYTVETIESLHAYADRLHRDRAQFSASHTQRRGTVRELIRRVRRSG
jgi:hypothetical protein